MPDERASLTVRVNAGLSTDSKELAELSQQLRRELLQSDTVTDVLPVSENAAPSGSKGDPVSLGALAVTVAPIALQGLINLIQSWLLRHDRATVTVESRGEKIIVTGSPSAEQEQLIKNFLGRHQKRAR